jgi:hypothetical protein
MVTQATERPEVACSPPFAISLAAQISRLIKQHKDLLLIIINNDVCIILPCQDQLLIILFS